MYKLLAHALYPCTPQVHYTLPHIALYKSGYYCYYQPVRQQYSCGWFCTIENASPPSVPVWFSVLNGILNGNNRMQNSRTHANNNEKKKTDTKGKHGETTGTQTPKTHPPLTVPACGQTEQNLPWYKIKPRSTAVANPICLATHNTTHLWIFMCASGAFLPLRRECAMPCGDGAFTVVRSAFLRCCRRRFTIGFLSLPRALRAPNNTCR